MALAGDVADGGGVWRAPWATGGLGGDDAQHGGEACQDGDGHLQVSDDGL